MSSWRESIPSKYLKASDFFQPALLTVKKFTVETIGEDKRPVVWFSEEEKGLVINITNGNMLEKTFGSQDPETWIGKKIVAYATETDYKGERVECIRLRAPKPQPGAAPAAPQQPVRQPGEDDGTPF